MPKRLWTFSFLLISVMAFADIAQAATFADFDGCFAAQAGGGQGGAFCLEDRKTSAGTLYFAGYIQQRAQGQAYIPVGDCLQFSSGQILTRAGKDILQLKLTNAEVEVYIDPASPRGARKGTYTFSETSFPLEELPAPYPAQAKKSFSLYTTSDLQTLCDSAAR